MHAGVVPNTKWMRQVTMVATGLLMAGDLLADNAGEQARSVGKAASWVEQVEVVPVPVAVQAPLGGSALESKHTLAYRTGTLSDGHEIVDNNCTHEQVIAIGESMAPYLFSGEALIGMFGDCGDLQPGNMVVYDHRGTLAIKWLLGGPGQSLQIEDGQVFIDDKPLVTPEGRAYIISGVRAQGMARLPERIPDDHYLLLGNLDPNTIDSTRHGLVEREAIKGVAHKIVSESNPVALFDMGRVLRLVPHHVTPHEVYQWVGEYASEQGFHQAVEIGTEGTYPAIDITRGLENALISAGAQEPER